MAFVITQSCDCLAGPVALEELRGCDAEARKRRYPGVQMFIDPAECIDRRACVAECPVDAIRSDDALPRPSEDADANADADAERSARFFARRR